MSEISMTNMNKQVRPSFVAQLQKHWKLILGGLIIGGLVGYALVWNKSSTYTSAATIIFPASTSSKMAMVGASSSGGDLPAMPLMDGVRLIPQPGTSGATAMMLLQSRRANNDIITKMNDKMVQEYSKNSSGKGVESSATVTRAQISDDKITHDPTLLKNHYRVRRDDDLYKIIDNVISMKVGKNGELVIAVTGTNAKFANMLAQTVVDELGALTDALRLDPADESMVFFQQQVNDANSKFAEAQKNLMEFQKERNIVSLPDQARALAAQYSQLQIDVSQAELTAQIANDQYKKASKNAGFMIENFVDPISSNGSSGSSLAMLYKKVKDLESEKAILLTKLTESHPDVQNKSSQLEDARKMLDDEVQRQKELLKGNVSPGVLDLAANAFLTGARVDGLKVALAEMEAQVKTLPEQEASYARLSAEVDATSDAVKMYRSELEKARILSKDNGHVFEVLDTPDVPTQPNPGGRLKTIAIFALLGLLLPMALPALKFSRELQEYEDALLVKTEQASSHAGCPFMKEIRQQQDNEQ
ncbi:MAG: hypothetical protein WCJ56_02005 [bacterium]